MGIHYPCGRVWEHMFFYKNTAGQIHVSHPQKGVERGRLFLTVLKCVCRSSRGKNTKCLWLARKGHWKLQLKAKWRPACSRFEELLKEVLCLVSYKSPRETGRHGLLNINLVIWLSYKIKHRFTFYVGLYRDANNCLKTIPTIRGYIPYGINALKIKVVHVRLWCK